MPIARRQIPACRYIPIIMTSAVTEAAVRERFEGYQGFCESPFSLRHFSTLSRRF
jgi:hypothetical protein